MAEQAKLEDSNMANYGGEDHRNAAKAAAQTEKEYEGAGQKPGLEIWRVENRRTEDDRPDFGVKRWPKDQYGEFYDGDSYIVLNTYRTKDPETGKLTENLVQATARDVFAEGLLRIHKAGIRILWTVHDEVICEVPEDSEVTVETVTELLAQTPDWIPGLPVAAEGIESQAYTK